MSTTTNNIEATLHLSNIANTPAANVPGIDAGNDLEIMPVNEGTNEGTTARSLDSEKKLKKEKKPKIEDEFSLVTLEPAEKAKLRYQLESGNVSFLELLSFDFKRQNKNILAQLCLDLCQPQKARTAFLSIKSHVDLNNDLDSESLDYLILLSKCYKHGLGTKRDRKRSFKFCKIAADKQHPIGLMEYAEEFLVEDSKFVKKDVKKARELYQLAVQSTLWRTPHVKYGYQLICDNDVYGNENSSEEDIATGINLLTLAGEAGFIGAWTLLGSLYSSDSDTHLKPDDKRTLYYIQQAVKEGCPMASWVLGIFNLAGETETIKSMGISPNISEGISLVRSSAAKGYRSAQYQLGYFLECGLADPNDPNVNIPVDLKQAIELYYFASIQCSLEALEHLKRCYFAKGCNTDIPEDTRNLVCQQIKECVRKYYQAARLGNTVACYNLAYCYREGIIVKKNMKKAIHYFEKASEKGLGEADIELAAFYDQGLGTLNSPSQALECYKDAVVDDSDHLPAFLRYNDAFTPLKNLVTEYFEETGIQPATVFSKLVAEYAFEKERFSEYREEVIKSFFISFRNNRTSTECDASQLDFDPNSDKDPNLDNITQTLLELTYEAEKTEDDEKMSNSENTPGNT